jgi:hypothetical protein
VRRSEIYGAAITPQGRVGPKSSGALFVLAGCRISAMSRDVRALHKPSCCGVAALLGGVGRERREREADSHDNSEYPTHGCLSVK